jgi:sucrose-6-phosphate hydrolase SacC (GH32 family)
VLPLAAPHNRDPRVFWYAPEKKWIMALAFGHDSRQNGGKPTTNPNYGLFSSKDLKSWERMSSFFIDNTCDCPEFFEIPLDGDKTRTKWIFWSGDALYLVGSFDGTTFTPESGPHRLNEGNSFYASQTFNNIPASDGRRIVLARAHAGGDGTGFWGAVGLPVSLTLRTTAAGPRLCAWPVKELETLRVKSHAIPAQPLAAGANPLSGIEGRLFDVTAEVEIGDARTITFDLRGIPVVYDASKRILTCLDRSVPLAPVDGRISLRAFVDRGLITLFADGGRVYMSMVVMPPERNVRLGLAADGTGAAIRRAEVHELSSIWNWRTGPPRHEPPDHHRETGSSLGRETK